MRRRPLRLGTLLLTGLLAACAPTLQRAGRPDQSFVGPHLEADRFVSFDGARLGLTRWEAQGGEPRAVVVGVHGMNDYANAFHLAAAYWATQGVTTYAYDQRGFGRSPQRGVWAPDTLKIEDLRTIVALVRQRYPRAVIAVVGESLGAAVAMEAFASASPPAADRLVLLAPAVWGWSTQPLPDTVLLWLAAHAAPGAVITPPNWLTRKITPTDNRAELVAMSEDPLMIWGARFDTLYGLVDTMERAWQGAAMIHVPTLYLYGAHDDIIPKAATRGAVARLSPSDRTAYYRAGYHLLLRDHQALNVWRDVAAFIADPAAPLPSGAPPITPAALKERAPPARPILAHAGL